MANAFFADRFIAFSRPGGHSIEVYFSIPLIIAAALGSHSAQGIPNQPLERLIAVDEAGIEWVAGIELWIVNVEPRVPTDMSVGKENESAVAMARGEAFPIGLGLGNVVGVAL
jgi:hypothetical protein